MYEKVVDRQITEREALSVLKASLRRRLKGYASANLGGDDMKSPIPTVPFNSNTFDSPDPINWMPPGALAPRDLDEGCSGWWVPDAKVEHIIPARRQSARYIFQYYYSAGETWALFRNVDPVLANQWGPALEFRRVFKGIPTLTVRFMLYHATRSLLFRYLANPGIWLNELRYFAFYCEAIGYWRKVGYTGNRLRL
jgi:hypothetical protein